ncbi:metalloprotease [Mycena crocata]|nr:metalloprotease [Mycena crocata]
MGLTSVAIALLFVVFSAYGSPVVDVDAKISLTRQRGCGTRIRPETLRGVEEQFQANQTRASTEKSAISTINVHWHVISKDANGKGGNIPASQIAKQIKVLNADYSGAFKWNLASTTRTVNPDWFANVGPSTPQQAAMKAALRRGGKGDLNVYSVGFTSGSVSNLLGYSTFPSQYSSSAQDDGIVLLFSSLPGGSTTKYNLGRTLTHESGHWLGLYHPFQGGCVGSGSSSAGDYVSDTPSQASPTTGCPAKRDTCPEAGVDGVHNFMDYSDDRCMKQFTAGQMARAAAQYLTYRR